MSSVSSFRQPSIVVASCVAVAYLAYRTFYTLNDDTPYAAFASLMLLVGEAFGIVCLLLYFYQTWHVHRLVTPSLSNDRTIDVFITTTSDELAVLRATIEACVRMDYPHATYVLDDGKRPDVEALAKELGIHYIIRPTTEGGRAASLNHALARTTGELFVVLEGDHVPESRLIRQLIGHFRDAKVAFAQTPHAFYNFDSFQARLDHKGRKFWDAGGLDAHVVQPGRNRSGCAAFAGSAVMVRRAAVDDVNGVSSNPIETGLRMHRRGWKSVAVAERLVAGRAAPDIATFHDQQRRDGADHLATLSVLNPFAGKGLGLSRRLHYLGGALPWAFGPFKLMIYLTPILALFSGVLPVNAIWPLVLAFLGYYAITSIGYLQAGNGRASVTRAELFAMVNFWTSTVGLLGLPPTRSKSVWANILPQLTLAVLGMLALAWGWSRWCFGLTDDVLAIGISSVWILAQLAMVYLVTRRAFWPQDRRSATRHVVHLPLTYELMPIDPDGQRFGVTADLNEGGVGFVAYEVLPPNAVLRVIVRGAGQVVECEAQVKTAAALGGTGTMHGYRYGCQFRNLSPRDSDAINRVCLHYAVPRLYAEYEAGNRDTFWRKLVRSRSAAPQRQEYRYPYHLPVVVYRYGTREDGFTHEPLFTATDDLSKRAFAVLVEEPLPLGSQVGYHMQSPLGEVRGHAKVIRADEREYAGVKYYRAVLEWGDFEGQGRNALQLLIDPRGADGIEKTLVPEAQPPSVSMRMPIVVALLVALPLLAVERGVFRYVTRDDLFLREVAELRPGLVSMEQNEHIDAIMNETLANEHPGDDRLELLAAALAKAGRGADESVVRGRLRR